MHIATITKRHDTRAYYLYYFDTEVQAYLRKNIKVRKLSRLQVIYYKIKKHLQR